MFPRHVSKLEYSDIQNLVEVRKEPEGLFLDYKRELGNQPKAKAELAKDFAALANSSGGFLVFGVTNSLEIEGIEAQREGQKVQEWVRAVISSNVQPSLFYHDPRIIALPDSEKVIMVIHIPESTIKPHMACDDGRYYVRVNDSNQVANHNQVRDMFEFSRSRSDAFQQLLEKRNLWDENDPDFTMNQHSIRLKPACSEPHLQHRGPRVLFTIIPKNPSGSPLPLSIGDFKKWLKEKQVGYQPRHDKQLYFLNDNFSLGMDGVVMRDYRLQPSWYFNIQFNGILESGFSDVLVWCVEPKSITESRKQFVNLTWLLGHEMMLLGFAKEYLALLKCSGEAFLQISLADVLGFKLIGWHSPDQINAKMHASQGNRVNTIHRNIKLLSVFNPETLDEHAILEVVQGHSRQLCWAFGLEDEMGFVNGSLDTNYFSQFKYP